MYARLDTNKGKSKISFCGIREHFMKEMTVGLGLKIIRVAVGRDGCSWGKTLNSGVRKRLHIFGALTLKM